MPVSPRSTSPHFVTPSRSRQSYSTSYTPTVVSGGGQQKLNIVTRVAIEGKVKKGQDGASVKIYLKIAIPLDAASPGSTISLFPEENLKVLSSQVHPLDSNGAPYNFSSAQSPLLHHAARSLNLPARTHQTFEEALKHSRVNGFSSAIRNSKSEGNDLVAPVDINHAGQILVSGYHVAFFLPKEFLARVEGEDETFPNTPLSSHSRHRREDASHEKTPVHRRRHSISERNQVQFMAAIDMWVPFLNKPPRSPFLLSIPTPRCLHNSIKLRIAPPDNTSTSFASLGSIDDDCNWDLACDPQVNRNPTNRSRSGSYGNLADDESSDTDTAGSSEACVIQGTFPSAERIRLRWAKPTKAVNVGEDDLLKAGAENVKGEMSCSIRGKAMVPGHSEEGVLMDVEYKGHCKRVWTPAVATLLGLDVVLVARGCDVHWAPGQKAQWDIEGGNGYTGFVNTPPSRPQLTSRTSSIDSNGAANVTPTEMYETARSKANESHASLLRAPLPTQNIGDISLDNSGASLPSNVSSASIQTSVEMDPPKPTSTITLHLNMNDLQPAHKNSLSFRVSGSILVVPKRTVSGAVHLASSTSTENDRPTDLEPITLPRFTVLAADVERISTTVKNEVESASVEVYQPHGDIQKDPQVRKTVLQKNGSTRCGEDGGRIGLKFFDPYHFNAAAGEIHTPGNRPRTPSNNNTPTRSPRNPLPTRAKREGPPIIASVNASITPLTPGDGHFPDGYAVRLSLNTPAIVDSEWLDFGMSIIRNKQDDPVMSGASTSTSIHSKGHSRPKIVLICASVDGVPVRAELNPVRSKSDMASFENVSGKQWLCWGKIHAGAAVGASMVIDYLVKEQSPLIDGKGKKKAPQYADLNILLPTFSLPVGRLEATIHAMSGLEVSDIHSEFDYVHATPDGHRLLLLYSMQEYTQPRLSLVIRKATNRTNHAVPRWYFLVTWVLLLSSIVFQYQFHTRPSRFQWPSGSLATADDGWQDLHSITSNPTQAGRDEWSSESSTSIAPTAASSSTSTISLSSSSSASRVVHTHSPPSVIHPHTPSADYQDDDDETHETSITSFVHSPLEMLGLMPIAHFFTFRWTEDHSAAFQETLEKMSVGMHFVWDICRKVYHYPLDPP